MFAYTSVFNQKATPASPVVFTTVGTTTWEAPKNVYQVQYLVVGGGSGGEASPAISTGITYPGGGGGAGMFRTGFLSVVPGQRYTVTVGAGSAGQATRLSPLPAVGGSSVFSSITSTGGDPPDENLNGAGGAAQVGTTTSARGGSNGNNIGGGSGGGSSGAGGSNGGAPGAGTVSNLRAGVNVTYSRGGQGGQTTGGASGIDAPANSGNGGGGGSSGALPDATGGDGGSGIVVLKY
jgi:hypothetical protein